VNKKKGNGHSSWLKKGGWTCKYFDLTEGFSIGNVNFHEKPRVGANRLYLKVI